MSLDDSLSVEFRFSVAYEFDYQHGLFYYNVHLQVSMGLDIAP